MDDEAVAQFVAVTGAAADRAEQYMTLSDGNVEQAIQLWYETGGIDMMGATASPARPAAAAAEPPPAPHHSRPQPDVVNLDSDEEGDVQVTGESAQSEPSGSRAAPNQLEEDDEAIARRLQEEMYAGGDMGDAVDPEGVRAPIARTTETLVGPEPYDLSDPTDRAAAVAEQLMRRQQDRARTARGGAPSIWDQSEDFTDQMRARADRATGPSAEATRKTTMLAEMFRPPFELMSRLSWDEARDEGKEEQKWILVNVQDASIFDCQLLNRDIWKHEGIKETVSEHFIFLQYAKDDPRGSQYMQYYFPSRDTDSAYPHIAIVDPRTGEQVKVWSGPPPPKPMEFLMQLHEFLDRYSLSAAAKNPVARRKPAPPPESAASRIERMTEDEQMQMAMQASLAGGGSSSTGENNEGGSGPSGASHSAAADPDDLTRSIPDLRSGVGSGDVQMSDAAPVAAAAGIAGHGMATPPPEPRTNPAFAAIPADQPHTEPGATAAGTTRLQFRHPEGRVVRRFLLSDPVQRLYEWLKAEPLPGLAGKEFALSFMGRNLLADVQDGKTIEAAGLRNGSVNVEVVEDGGEA